MNSGLQGKEPATKRLSYATCTEVESWKNHA
jgi:hypothetical protein